MANRTIRFKCSSGCKANPNDAHMDPGDVITLEADGVDATITFVKDSPFVSKTNPIYVANGKTDAQVVSDAANGSFDYTLSCGSACPSSVNNPKMIVP